MGSGNPSLKVRKKQTDKNHWSATKIYPDGSIQLLYPMTSTLSQKHQTAIYPDGSVQLLCPIPQPGHRNISLLSAHSSWPTEQSFPTTTKRTQMLHVENDLGFDSKKSKRGWGWRRNKTSCKKFISEAGWWKHQACYISLLSPSKKENTEAMWT